MKSTTLASQQMEHESSCARYEVPSRDRKPDSYRRQNDFGNNQARNLGQSRERPTATLSRAAVNEDIPTLS